MFAQVFHPSMRFAAGPRREIGIRTVFNLLGPLTNPAGARSQLIGVANPELGEKMAQVLGILGSEHSLVVHGADGLDEMTLSGESQVWELKDGKVEAYTVTPTDLGFDKVHSGELRVSSADESAKVLRDVLNGAAGPTRNVVVVNAAAGLLAVDRVRTLNPGRQGRLGVDRQRYGSGQARWLHQPEPDTRIAMTSKLDVHSVLTRIVDVKRREVERLKVEIPLAALERRIETQTSPLDAKAALNRERVAIIAEIKKASPAKGLLMPNFDAGALASTYVENGASAISVLTNVDHFQGSIDHLETARSVAYPAGVPVLRKEFMFDPYQVYEARAYGADLILLIVAMLAAADLRSLQALSHDLGMQCLVEVHDERELDTALDIGATIIGINNRDLRTFKTDIETTERLAPAVPSEKTVVSESGINTPDHISRVRDAGAHAALIGEALVTSGDPGAKLRELA